MAKPNPVDGKPTGVFIPGGDAVLGLRHPRPRARRSRCSCTRTRSPRACRRRRRNTVRRNAAILPAYSFVLGLLALLGWVAIAAGTKPIGGRRQAQRAAGASRSCSRTPSRRGSPAWPSRRSRSGHSSLRRSCRSRRRTPSPATSTRSGSSPTRPSSRRPRSPSSPRWSSSCSRWSSCCCSTSRTRSTSSCSVASGSCRPSRPSCCGLYTRWLHRWALLAGWAVGMAYGTWQAWNVANPRAGINHFGGSLANMPGHRPARLHRAHRVRHQPGRRGRAHVRPARRQGARRRRRDDPWRLLRRLR